MIVGPSLLRSTAVLPEQVEASFRENVVTVAAHASSLFRSKFLVSKGRKGTVTIHFQPFVSGECICKTPSDKE